MVEVLLYQDRDGSEKVWTATMGADVRRWSAEAPEDEYHRKTKDDHRRARRDHRGERTRADVINGAPGTWFASARKPPQDPPKDPSSSDGARLKPPGRDAVPLRARDGPRRVGAGDGASPAGGPPPDPRAGRRRRTGGVGRALVLARRHVPPGPPERMERVAAELNGATPVSVPSWFQANARSGSLAVTLTPTGAFRQRFVLAATSSATRLRRAQGEPRRQVVHAPASRLGETKASIEARDVEENRAREGDGDSASGRCPTTTETEVAEAAAETRPKKTPPWSTSSACRPRDDGVYFATPSRPPPVVRAARPPRGTSTVLMPAGCLRHGPRGGRVAHRSWT